MRYLITAYDGEDALARRMAVRPRHLENLARIISRVICAGGLQDESGKTIGSALVMDFASREELDEYLAGEPYVTGGVWKDIRVEPMNVVIVNGDMVGQ